MEQYAIKGGNPLVGEVEIGGAKNAALAILAASLMTDETVLVENMPDVRDTNVLLQAMQSIGVMVERIEGFCTEEEWRRAYREINEMEHHLTNSGAVVLKFWMQIDKDEQERRFTERMNTPEKQWKITDEDWRNREKWDQYEVAVNEMLLRTSTTYAPWIIVEGNDKYYARVKVLETVVHTIEKKIEEKRQES